MTNTAAFVLSTFIGQRTFSGLLIMACGILLLAGAGFAGSDFLHNAAHDTRHAIGFPCH
ncbi:MAG TPA: CbtB domain-containing protein [Aestuariivirgaceae bacterium]|jgi:cobalt transporter subunit CbtB